MAITIEQKPEGASREIFKAFERKIGGLIRFNHLRTEIIAAEDNFKVSMAAAGEKDKLFIQLLTDEARVSGPDLVAMDWYTNDDPDKFKTY